MEFRASRQPGASRIQAAAVAIVAALAFAVPISAQEIKADPPADGAKIGAKILFALKTDANINEQNLRTLLNVAAEKHADNYGLSWAKDPKITPTTPEIYQFLQGIAGPEGGSLLTRQQIIGPRIEPEGGGASWLIVLDSPELALNKIDLLDGNGQVMETVNRDDPRLEAAGSDRIRFKRTFRNYPRRYVLSLSENGKAIPSLTRDWPIQPAAYWLITLTQFKGDLEKLFEMLRNEDFTIPIQDIVAADRSTIVLGDLSTGKPPIEVDVKPNGEVDIVVPPVRPRPKPGPKPDGAYVQFPLTPSALQEQLGPLQGMDGPGLTKYIQSQNPKTWDPNAQLDPEMPPQWWYVPRDPATGGFRMPFRPKNPRGWGQRFPGGPGMIEIYGNNAGGGGGIGGGGGARPSFVLPYRPPLNGKPPELVVGGPVPGLLPAIENARSVEPSNPPSVDGSKSKARILFALKTDANIQEQNLRTLLEAAADKYAQKYGLSWAKDPKISPINADTYKFLEGIASPDGARFLTGQLGPRIEPEGGTTVWLITLGGPNYNLNKIEFLDANDKVVETVSRDDKRLEFVGLGRFKFTHDFTNKYPKKYALTMVENGKEPVTLTREWPVQAAAYWLINFNRFEGELEKFFDMLRNEDFPIPIQDVVASDRSTLVLGDLSVDKTPTGTVFTGSNIVFRFPLIQLRKKTEPRADKAYILFPLTKTQAEETLEKLKSMNEQQLMEYVMDQKPSPPGDPDAKLDPRMKPRWFEAVPHPGAYQRDIPIVDAVGWQQRDDKEIWRIVVYRLTRKPNDSGKDLAILVPHPTKETLVAAVDEPEKAWLPGVSDLVKRMKDSEKKDK